MFHKSTRKLIVLLLIFAGVAACTSQGTLVGGNVQLSPITPNEEGELRENDLLIAGIAEQPVQERVVIKNANLLLVVEDPDAKLLEINTLADEFGGWVVSANTQRGDGEDDARVTSASITIRVLADRLDEALARIKNGAQSVESETVTGQDVTQEYIDLSSRLTNLQAAEVQLQEIMESASETEDVLSIYNELVRIRGEIEATRGQIRYYEESAAYSSIQVTLLPSQLARPVEIAGWRPLDTARDAFQILVNVLRFAVDLAIVVVVLVVPLLIVFGLPSWFIYRRYRRSRRPAPQAS